MARYCKDSLATLNASVACCGAVGLGWARTRKRRRRRTRSES